MPYQEDEFEDQCTWVELRHRPLRYSRCHRLTMTQGLCLKHYRLWQNLERERLRYEGKPDPWGDDDDVETRFGENPHYYRRRRNPRKYNRNPETKKQLVRKIYAEWGHRYGKAAAHDKTGTSYKKIKEWVWDLLPEREKYITPITMPCSPEEFFRIYRMLKLTGADAFVYFVKKGPNTEVIATEPYSRNSCGFYVMYPTTYSETIFDSHHREELEEILQTFCMNSAYQAYTVPGDMPVRRY